MKRLFSCGTALAWLLAVLLSSAQSGEKKEPPKKRPNPAFTSEKEAGADFLIQGEYVGKHGDHKVAAQVIARGDGRFVIKPHKGGLPGDGWDGESKKQHEASTEDGKVIFKG